MFKIEVGLFQWDYIVNYKENENNGKIDNINKT